MSMKPEDAGQQITQVSQRIALEIQDIKNGKRYRSAAEIDVFADEIWEAAKSFRSDALFELTDHFRLLSNLDAMEGLDRTSGEIFALLHQMLAKKMAESEDHRDFLFQKFGTRIGKHPTDGN
jgi:hypothetical protein